MRSIAFFAFLFLPLSSADAQWLFIRGDCNGDSVMNVADPVATLQHLFGSGFNPPCSDSCDANDDGALDVADSVFSLNFQFSGGPMLAGPWPNCGTDSTPDVLTCTGPLLACPPTPPAADLAYENRLEPLPDNSLVVLEDRDGDGALDLVVAHDGGIEVRLGTGDGVFGAPTNYPVVGMLIGGDFQLGDLNNDGVSDLAAPNYTDELVTVVLGVSGGGFGAGTDYPMDHRPNRLRYSDVNGDSNLDLLVMSGTDQRLYTYLGNGDGSLQLPILLTLDAPRGMAVGDFNEDGIEDFVYTSRDTPDGLRVHLGFGDGTYAPPITVPTSNLPMNVEPLDANEDGILDLVVAHAGSQDAPTMLLLGVGDGTFQAPFEITSNNGARLRVADMDGDGHVDIVEPCPGFTVWLGDGTGTFIDSTDCVWTGGGYESWLAVGDLNGDGLLDVVNRNSNSQTYQDNFSVSLANGDGTFGPTLPRAFIGGSKDVVLSDFDGDGDLDIAASREGHETLLVSLNDGSGVFQEQPAYSVPSPVALACADIDADGDSDIVVGSYTDGLHVFRGNGDGTFAPDGGLAPGAMIFSVELGDFNGDGLSDIVATSETVVVFVQDALGGFLPGVEYAAGDEPRDLGVDDLDGDGTLDFVCGNGDYTYSVFLGVGDGTFVPAPVVATSMLQVPSPISVALGDLNGDVVPDLLFTTGTAVVRVRLGNGDGSFSDYTDFDLYETSREIRLLDANFDGNLDFVCSLEDQQAVALHLGDGMGGFTRYGFYGAIVPRTVSVGDIDGDGDYDLVGGAGAVRRNLILP